MQASMVASFIVFALTGAYTFWKYHLPFHSALSVEVLVYFTLIFNACYFFYVEAYTESNNIIRHRLKSVGTSEWLLRVIAQIELFLLWFFLQISWKAFLIMLVLLYVTYLAWDAITWDALEKHSLAVLDLAGTLLALGLLWLMGGLSKQGEASAIIRHHFLQYPVADRATLQNLFVSDPNYMMMLGFVMACFLVLAILGVCIIKFNPFADFLNKTC